MFRIVKKSVIIFLISILLIAPCASTALAEDYFQREDPSGGMMIYDFILVRRRRLRFLGNLTALFCAGRQHRRGYPGAGQRSRSLHLRKAPG